LVLGSGAVVPDDPHNPDTPLRDSTRAVPVGGSGVPTETIDVSRLLGGPLGPSGVSDVQDLKATSFGKLLHAVPIPAFLVDPTGRVVFANRAWRGITPDFRSLEGLELSSFFLRKTYVRKAEALVGKVLSTRKTRVFEAPMLIRDRRIWARMHFRSVRMHSAGSVLVLIEDLTADKKRTLRDKKYQKVLKRAHADLERRVHERTRALSEANERMRREISDRKRVEERLKLAGRVISVAGEAIFIADADGLIVDVNDAFCMITGRARDQVIGRDLTVFDWGPNLNGFREGIWREVIAKGEWRGEVWDRHRNGELYPILLSLNALRNNGTEISHFVGFFSDITGMKETQERLSRLAHFDSLTGLPNRLLFKERLDRAIASASGNDRLVAVMMLDLDRFKTINDTMGHRFGDRFLVALGKRLSSCLHEGDTVCRLGGDEFAFILTGIVRPRDVSKIARRIMLEVSRPVILDGREVFTTASAGISLYPSDSRKVDRMLRNADTAMYHAKDHGKNHFQFFSREMNATVLKRLKLENILRMGMAADRFLLHYQPMVDTESVRMIGMEALLRLEHPNLGVVSAANLVPVAEETGLIVPLGEWVLRSACAQNRKWQEMGLPPCKVSVNVSGRQLKDRNIEANIMKILEQTDLDPKFLEIELTESVMIEDADRSIEILDRLKDAGISISIDDFGQGFSSLSYLRDLPINKIKIDRSFLRDISPNSYGQALVKAVLTVAHSRRLNVVAEGVETEEQFRFLRSLGCDQAQGYLFARPSPVDDFTEILRNDSPLGPSPSLSYVP
jgi:diguanylate cyclase (GGDEF)-like protein/PAS domain S-box-containing protein